MAVIAVADVEQRHEPERAVRSFVNRDMEGSTSNALAAILAAHDLKPMGPDAPVSAAAGAAVYLAAPRDAIPWAQLEEGPQLTLVNKLRGHEILTRKSKLARLLRDHPAQPHPQTFVIVPEPLRAAMPGLSAIQADKRRALAANDAQERYVRVSRAARARPAPSRATRAEWRRPGTIQPGSRVGLAVSAPRRVAHVPCRRARSAALVAADTASPSCWIAKDAQGAKGDNIAVCASAAAAIDEAESGRHATAVVVQRRVGDMRGAARASSSAASHAQRGARAPPHARSAARVRRLTRAARRACAASHAQRGARAPPSRRALRYVRAPLLLPGGRKFDIRLWVLFDADYRVYTARSGLVRPV